MVSAATQVHITTFTEEERTALRGRLTCLGASVLDKMEQHNLPHVLIAKRAKGNKYEVRALSGGGLRQSTTASQQQLGHSGQGYALLFAL